MCPWVVRIDFLFHVIVVHGEEEILLVFFVFSFHIVWWCFHIFPSLCQPACRIGWRCLRLRISYRLSGVREMAHLSAPRKKTPLYNGQDHSVCACLPYNAGLYLMHKIFPVGIRIFSIRRRCICCNAARGHISFLLAKKRGVIYPVKACTDRVWWIEWLASLKLYWFFWTLSERKVKRKGTRKKDI